MPLFCPVYVLKNKLQAGQPFDKWASRARLGVYLGRSPIHARSIALVLNIATGRVSPQFHVKFDPSFATVNVAEGNHVPKATWRVSCGFQRGKSILKVENRAGIDTAPEFIQAADTGETIKEGKIVDDGKEPEQAPTDQADTTGKTEGDPIEESSNQDETTKKKVHFADTPPEQDQGLRRST